MIPFLRRKILFKILVMFIAAVSIPAIIIGVLSIRHSTDHIIRQVDLSSNNLLAEKKFYIEQQLNEIESITNMVIGSKEYQSLMQSHDNPARLHDAMHEMLVFFSKRKEANPNLVSIYLINRDQDYVLSKAKYSLAEFNDREALAHYPIGGPFAGLPRYLEVEGSVNPSGEKEHVISFARSITDFNSGSRVDILVNFDYNQFAAKLQSDYNPYHMDLLVFNDRNQLVLNQSAVQVDEMQMKAIRGSEGDSRRLTIDKTDYYYSKSYSESLRWTFVYMQPYVKMVGTADLLGNVLRSTIILVVVLALALAGFFTISLYKPLGSLVALVRKQSAVKNGKGNDEYSFIGSAVNALFHENHTLQSRYELAYPYLKQHSVQELLGGNVWDPEKWQSIIELLGVEFHEPYFAVAVMDFENTQLNESLAQEIEVLMAERSSACLLSAINNCQLAVVINTGLGNDGVHALFGDIQRELNARGIELTISYTTACTGLNMLSLAYQEALRQLKNKFYLGKNRLISSDTFSGTEESKAHSDKRLQEELLDGIRSQDMKKALEILAAFMNTIARQAQSIAYIKYLCFQVSSGLRESIMEVGGRLEAETEPEQIWDAIDRADTLQELETFLQQFLQQCMTAAAGIKQKQHMELAAKAMEYIRGHYHQDLSIKDIAASVYLSPGYLSTIFKSETGLTVMDYLTRIRMEAAKELLHNGEIKISDIAQAIGYNNPQSFIRFFKKAYQMTPMEYRRNLVLLRE